MRDGNDQPVSVAVDSKDHVTVSGLLPSGLLEAGFSWQSGAHVLDA